MANSGIDIASTGVTASPLLKMLLEKLQRRRRTGKLGADDLEAGTQTWPWAVSFQAVTDRICNHMEPAGVDLRPSLEAVVKGLRKLQRVRPPAGPARSPLLYMLHQIHTGTYSNHTTLDSLKFDFTKLDRMIQDVQESITTLGSLANKLEQLPAPNAIEVEVREAFGTKREDALRALESLQLRANDDVKVDFSPILKEVQTYIESFGTQQHKMVADGFGQVLHGLQQVEREVKTLGTRADDCASSAEILRELRGRLALLGQTYHAEVKVFQQPEGSSGTLGEKQPDSAHCVNDMDSQLEVCFDKILHALDAVAHKDDGFAKVFQLLGDLSAKMDRETQSCPVDGINEDCAKIASVAHRLEQLVIQLGARVATPGPPTNGAAASAEPPRTSGRDSPSPHQDSGKFVPDHSQFSEVLPQNIPSCINCRNREQRLKDPRPVRGSSNK